MQENLELERLEELEDMGYDIADRVILLKSHCEEIICAKSEGEEIQHQCRLFVLSLTYIRRHPKYQIILSNFVDKFRNKVSKLHLENWAWAETVCKIDES